MTAFLSVFAASCATVPPEPSLAPRKENMFAVTASNQLIYFNAGQPRKILVKKPLTGLVPGEDIIGIDFRVDRIRVVSNTGQNLRLHPDTGAVVDANPGEPGIQIDSRLAFDAADANAGKPVSVVAAAYTCNKVNDKITTNFAIDGMIFVDSASFAGAGGSS